MKAVHWLNELICVGRERVYKHCVHIFLSVTFVHFCCWVDSRDFEVDEIGIFDEGSQIGAAQKLNTD